MSSRTKIFCVVGLLVVVLIAPSEGIVTNSDDDYSKSQIASMYAQAVANAHDAWKHTQDLRNDIFDLRRTTDETIVRGYREIKTEIMEILSYTAENKFLEECDRALRSDMRDLQQNVNAIKSCIKSDSEDATNQITIENDYIQSWVEKLDTYVEILRRMDKNASNRNPSTKNAVKIYEASTLDLYQKIKRAVTKLTNGSTLKRLNQNIAACIQEGRLTTIITQIQTDEVKAKQCMGQRKGRVD